jgi:hypothetical protein
MIKIQLLTRDIRSKRREVSQLQEALGNMQDHLTVLEARAKNSSKRTYTPAEVRTMLGLPVKR